MTVICAHRGASLWLPDNSILAFEAAIESGADAIETDVRRAPDGRLVLAHDREEAAHAEVALAELVERARGRIGLDLELKEEGLEEDVLEAVVDGEDWLLVTSFLPAAIGRIGELAPEVRTGLLVEGRGDAVEAARDCSADALLVEDERLDAALVREAAAAGLAVWSWTVDDAARIDRLLADPAVEGVITNDPATALERRAAGADTADA